MKIKSNKGFYIGDICYVLQNDDINNPYNKWLDEGFKEGETVSNSGISFLVANAANGDGVYFDQTGGEYSVDAGNIGVVPLELVIEVGSKKSPLIGYRVHKGPGTATLENKNGVITATLPDGTKKVIDTNK